MSPPRALAMARAIGSPSPVPVAFVVKNGSEIRRYATAGIAHRHPDDRVQGAHLDANAAGTAGGLRRVLGEVEHDLSELTARAEGGTFALHGDRRLRLAERHSQGACHFFGDVAQVDRLH